MADSNQPIDTQHPDLEESTNVAESHGAMLEGFSAAKREKRLREDGMEPVSLWIVLGSAFVLLVGGGVLGAGGGLFDYKELRVDGYVQKVAPGAEDSGPLTAPAMKAFTKNGAKVYSKCTGCHQSNGMGVDGSYPPLAGSEWVTGDTEAIAMIILNGLEGEITVKGKTWRNVQMEPQGPMSPVELASVMTYIRNSFGNATGDVVTTEMAKAAIKISNERAGGKPIGPKLTAAELTEKHAKMLPGETLAPEAVIDLESFEPVEAAAPEEE
jgi:mono/diheme cytochrome c family protein